MTTPPQDPFGTPREGEGPPSDRPQWDQPQRSPQPHLQQQEQWGQQQAPGQPYAQQYAQPAAGQSYGAPPQGYGVPQAWTGPTQTESKAIIALVCAIAAWVVFPLLPAIAALMIGKTARREIDQSGGRLTGDGLVTAAKVIAWANIVLCLLGVVLAVLAFGVFAVSAADVS